MKQLPTIEEFYIQKWGVCPMIEKEIALHSYYEMLSFAKDFAKLHVQAALESAAEKGRVEVVIIPNDQPSSSFGDDYTYIVDKQSILDAYPLDNIK